MVGLTKKSLRIILHHTTLTIRQLETVLFECEALVNNRPLSAVKEDEILLPITPAQLCVGKDLLHLPGPGPIGDGQQELTFIEKWRQRKALVNSFWKRWRNEYLLALAPTKKWILKNEQAVKVGDVVLLRENHLSKNEWKLARVHNVIQSKDGLVRAANVRLPSGSVVHRHCNKLALLEENMVIKPPLLANLTNEQPTTQNLPS